MFKEFLKNITDDIKVDLTEEFDRNFERKAFFDKSWKQGALINNKGSMMMRSGNLRRSIRSTVKNGRITFSSSLPYASIHNEGGEIAVTEKMKSFFWAMYYKTSGAISMKKNGEARENQRNKKLSIEAQQWKNLALMKVGKKMKIEQRQFIGYHPEVSRSIERIVNNNAQLLAAEITKKLKQ